MCDELTRENIGRDLKRSIKADDVIKILDQAQAARSALGDDPQTSAFPSTDGQLSARAVTTEGVRG